MPYTPSLPWVLAGVVSAAWLALILWGASPYARYLRHDSDGGAAGVALFIVGWTLMTAAMMLPTTTRLLRTFEPIAYHQPRPALVVGAVIVGFLSAWGLVGMLMQAVDIGVHAAVDYWAWLEDRKQLIATSVLILAGGYQWSTLKDRCLTNCRSPRSFVYRYWMGGAPLPDALRIGLGYGMSCVGCCWALMLLLFAIGSGNLAWMLALGSVMAIEKNVEGGRRVSAPLGALLLAIGAALGIDLLVLA